MNKDIAQGKEKWLHLSKVPFIEIESRLYITSLSFTFLWFLLIKERCTILFFISIYSTITTTTTTKTTTDQICRTMWSKGSDIIFRSTCIQSNRCLVSWNMVSSTWWCYERNVSSTERWCVDTRLSCYRYVHIFLVRIIELYKSDLMCFLRFCLIYWASNLCDF